MRLIFLLILLPAITFAQHQERKLLVYNIGFGAVTSGIGAVINKPKKAKLGPYFIKGFWQGSIGGLLHFSGKKVGYLINDKEHLAYGWPAKLAHSAGSAIIESAALNKPFLKDWHVDYGPIRIDFSISNNKKAKVRFLPYSVFSIIAGLNIGNFDLQTTLLTGNIAFKSPVMLPGNNQGVSYGRALGYVQDSLKYFTISHELIHQFQFNEYQVFNTWFAPFSMRIKSNKVKNVFEKYIYLDIPYFVPVYGIEGQHPLPYYYQNFFEFEAQRFATNQYVQVH